jgi:hypothetical protein
VIETNTPRTITEPLISPSVLNAGLAAPYLPDYIWEVANPVNFGASTAVDKMNDILLAFDPNTPGRDFGNHDLARGIMEREQPSIHETIRRSMVPNVK